MAKYCGVIGFVTTKETSPGVWTEEVVERRYYGDVLRNTRRWASSNDVNDNVDIGNTISIVSDEFAFKNFQFMRYAEWMNCKWKISSVEVNYPRMNITIGGVYNG